MALLETEEKKTDYLRGLYETTYLRDVIERNHLRNPEGLKELVRVMASGIGSSTNPTRIANTFQSAQGVAIKRDTIKQYIDYLKDSFLIEEAQERRPLLSINDHFRKIVIVGDDIHRKEDELGVLTVGLLDFLTDKKLLEQG